MSTLAYIIIFSLLGSIVSMVGGMLLLINKKLAERISHLLAAFAAGTLLASAFIDLLPEAFHALSESGTKNAGAEQGVFLAALVGILFFFFMERAIHWFHHHGREHEKSEARPTVALVTLGDSVHNFIDGVVMAATFMVDINLGIVTTLAVMAHEIPQEIGDFGILLNEGVSRTRVFLYNFFSALSAIAGALITYFLGNVLTGLLPAMLAVTAGFFIYIAATDLLPHIHKNNNRGFAFAESILLLLGVILIYGAITFLEH